MSIQSIFSRSLAATFVLSFAGLAFARQPPALVRAQTAADQAAACDPANVGSGAGYRDSLVRFDNRDVATPSLVVRTDGYRGRFEDRGAPFVACNTPAESPRLSARR
jgi:hypothetical protein